MASHSSFSEEDFSCSVCHDIFKHPLVLPCSHTFCKACVQEWWTHKKRKECPVCKNISSVNPSFNRALNNLCETFIKEKRLEVNNKEEAQEALKLLHEKLKIFNEVKTNCDRVAEHIKVERRNTEKQIKEQFKKFHQFLQKEEEALRMTALREETQQKSQLMKEEIEGLNRNVLTISNAVRAIEEDLKAERISFLQNYKTTVERVQFTLQAPQLVSGALLDKAKHLDNLTFSVCDKMKNIVSNVILHPYTAHPGRILSNDLTSGRLVERQKLPEDPQRSYSSSAFVMGPEVFNQGTHSWDVEVGDNRWWTVGVAKRDGGRSWKLRLYHGAYMAQSLPGSFTVLSVKQKPRRIRIQVDWDRGTLSFSDPRANTHLHTFTDTFTDTLVPFIFNCDDTVPLKML